MNDSHSSSNFYSSSRTCLDSFKLLIIICSLFFVNVNAAYSNLKYNDNWQQNYTHKNMTQVPGNLGVYDFKKSAANGDKISGGTVLTNSTLNVGGAIVNIPTSFRVAANAAIFAAEFSFGNPYIFAALAIGDLLSNYLVTDEIQILVDPGSETGWSKINKTQSCKFGSSCESLGFYKTMSSSIDDNCLKTSQCQYREDTQSYQNIGFQGEKVSGATKKPATLADFQRLPLSDDTLRNFPIPLPVSEPAFNPSQPITVPTVSRPYFFPTGDPVPGSEPGTYNQPGINVNPSPTPSQPNRVDLQPTSRTQNDPVPKTDSEQNPVTPPTQPASAAKPAAGEQLGLCDQYPNIEACAPAKKEFCEKNPKSSICQDLDVPDEEDIQEKTKDISISPDTGWMNGGGSCPPPVSFRSGGAEFSYQPYCDFLAGMRPVIIAVAWLSAAFILIGAKES